MRTLPPLALLACAVLACGEKDPGPETPVCSPACMNGGLCISPGICDCKDTGFEGDSCEVHVCSPACMNGGLCISPGICDCTDTGFEGDSCEVHVCSPACMNGGLCVSPGICDCTDTGFEGDSCAVRVCSPVCMNGGLCVSPGICDCTDTGFEGDSCEVHVCSPACMNGGLCVSPGTCDCTDTGFEGDSCAVRVCSPVCMNGGLCVSPGICDCTDTGFEGDSCDVPECADAACLLCLEEGPRPVTQRSDATGDWLFLANPTLQVDPVSLTGSGGEETSVVALTHPTAPLAGFLFSLPPPEGSPDLSADLARMETDLGSQALFQRHFTTWDGFPAVRAAIRLEGDAALRDARDRLLAQLLPWPAGQLSGLPGSGAPSSATQFLADLLLVRRGGQRLVAVGVVTPDEAAARATLRAEVEDLVNGSALGQFGDELVQLSEIVPVGAAGAVELMLALDDTGDTRDVQAALAAQAEALFDEAQSRWPPARWTALTNRATDDGSGVSSDNLCGLLLGKAGESGSLWAPFTETYLEAFRCKVRDPGASRACALPDPASISPVRGLGCPELAIDYVMGRSGPAGVSPARDRQRMGSALAPFLVSAREDERVGVDWTVDAAVLHATAYFEQTNPNFACAPLPVAALPIPGAPLTFVRLFHGEARTLPQAFTGPFGDAPDPAPLLAQALSAAAGAASSCRPASVPITASLRVELHSGAAGAPLRTPLPAGRPGGWESDPTAGSLTFFAPLAPAATDEVALCHLSFIKR